MSYMRWPLYAWTSAVCEDDCPLDCHDPAHIRWHLWARDTEEVNAFDRTGYDDAFTGGIELPGPLFDELVLCRYAEMVEDGIVADVAARVADPNSAAHGNFGSWAVRKAIGEDPDAEFAEKMREAGERRRAREAAEAAK